MRNSNSKNGFTEALRARFDRIKSRWVAAAGQGRRGLVLAGLLAALLSFISGCGVGADHAPKNIKPIGAADFESEVTLASMPVVVDFYAPWCGPCKVLSPRLDALAANYAGRIKFVQVNVDNAQALAERFKVEAIPMLLFVNKDGKVAETTVGLLSEETLRSKLESLARTAAAANEPAR